MLKGEAKIEDSNERRKEGKKNWVGKFISIRVPDLSTEFNL